MWRAGSKGKLSSRFAAWRVRPAYQFSAGRTPLAQCWLLAEWPADEEAPTKYFFSNLPLVVWLASPRHAGLSGVGVPANPAYATKKGPPPGTLPQARRALQQVLLCWAGVCITCGRPVARSTAGPSAQRAADRRENILTE